MSGKTDAQRQRERRRRRRDGTMRVTVDVPVAAREVFAEAKWIGAWDIDDAEAVRRALQLLVDGMRVDRPDDA